MEGRPRQSRILNSAIRTRGVCPQFTALWGAISLERVTASPDKWNWEPPAKKPVKSAAIA